MCHLAESMFQFNQIGEKYISPRKMLSTLIFFSDIFKSIISYHPILGTNPTLIDIGSDVIKCGLI